MFSRIRNRLTAMYAVVMILFLLAFISISYSGIVWLLYREEQQDLHSLAMEEAKKRPAILKRQELYLARQI